MSEPVSNVEIEDVLASIRRLVSDENRSTLRSEPVKKPFKPSRLVLTPSLLVPESAETARGSDSSPADEPDFNLTDKASLRLAETEDVQDSEAELPEIDDQAPEPEHSHLDADTESDSGEETETESGTTMGSPHSDQDSEPDKDSFQAPWMEPDSFLFAAAESAAEKESQRDDGAEQEGDDNSFDDGEPLDEAREPFEAQPDETPAEAAEESEADTSGHEISAHEGPQEDIVENPADNLQSEAAPSTEDTAPEPQETPLEDAVENPTGDRQPEAEKPIEDAGEEPVDAGETDTVHEVDRSEEPTTLGAKIAVLEAKIGQTHDQWEPDGEQGDDYAGTRVETIEWQDHEAEASAESESVPPDALDTQDLSESDPAIDPEDTLEPEPQQVASDDEDTLDVLGEGDAILDEESLRELVADIVRQELQGVLGERITRNVRKLVRREIHRALTAQELE